MRFTLILVALVLAGVSAANAQYGGEYTYSWKSWRWKKHEFNSRTLPPRIQRFPPVVTGVCMVPGSVYRCKRMYGGVPMWGTCRCN